MIYLLYVNALVALGFINHEISQSSCFLGSIVQCTELGELLNHRTRICTRARPSPSLRLRNVSDSTKAIICGLPLAMQVLRDVPTISGQLCLTAQLFHTPNLLKMVYDGSMGRTNIDIDEDLIREARKLTSLKTKREIVDRALDLLVRSERRKGILRYYGAGIWNGDLKSSRRNRG